LRKQEEARRSKEAIKIQTLIRGVLQRRKFKRNHRGLLRQRAIRVRAKKEKAALVVQCAFRCYRASKRLANQRLLVGEKVKERLEMETLEASVLGLHGEWMHELMVIRAQTGIRGMLARK
jgi:hypothetical protein